MVGMLEPSLMISRAKIGFSTIQIKRESLLYNTIYFKKLIFTNLEAVWGRIKDDLAASPSGLAACSMFRAGPLRPIPVL